MPDEPNKKMDEMLRAYAEERRKGSELPLHPATRNLLQGEVKRVFGHAPEPRPWWKRMRAFWPQIAFGGSLCLILGVAVLSLRQPPATPQQSAVETAVGLTGNDAIETGQKKTEETESLKREQAPSIASQADRAAPQAASAPPENRVLEPTRDLAVRARSVNRTVRSEPKTAADESSQSVAQRNESAATAGRAATLADATASAELETLSKEKDEARQAKPELSAGVAPTAPVTLQSESDAPKNFNAKAPVSAPALPTPTKLTRTVELTNLGAARRLNFVQVTDTSTRAGAVVSAVSTTGPVLTSFQVEQFGTNVRFLDRDGSVYVGVLAATNALAFSERKDDSAQVANSANYFFRVQGTNRTLGTDLLFTGQYFEQTNTAPNSLDTFAIAPGPAPRTTNQARHLIIGNATLGATNAPVRAVSREQ